MYYYEVTKNAILESKIDGKFYLVDFRKNVTDPNEYNWYFTVRQIMSNISKTGRALLCERWKAYERWTDCT